MKPFVVKPISHLKGTISPPGDKSIAHRSIIISSLSKGKTEIKNFPSNKDCFFTVRAFRNLGIKIDIAKTVSVYGKGLHGLKKARGGIFVGESGTTLRLLLGVLAGQNFPTRLIAGQSLSKRPMLRVNIPLRKMGAIIDAKCVKTNAKIEEYPPIHIQGGNLKSIAYNMPVASAQVKSAILLAGLYATGVTSISEPEPTRDHTERMLKFFKADIKVKQNYIVIKRNKGLVSPGKIIIPGDISSAAFFIVLALLIPNSEVLIKNVSLNPSRLGMVNVLKKMKADILLTKNNSNFSKFEPMGNVFVKSSSLRSTIVTRKEIPGLIDELPVLMVAACFARGKTVVEGVDELRVKETDRINSMVSNLRLMGADIRVICNKGLENIIVRGSAELKGARVRSFQDHRTAMSMIVAGLAAKNTTYLDDVSCINKSFPEFLCLLNSLRT